MLEKLQAVENRYEELCFRSEQPDFYADPKRAAAFLREKNELEPIVETFRAYNRASRDMEEAQDLMADPEMRELCQETFQKAKTDKENLYRELQVLLLPKDPNDSRNIFLEIRAGTGGDESALFAGDLLRMYLRYAEDHRWQTEIVSKNDSELGGYKEVIVRIIGEGAYSKLKFESGGHRVQRVPATESQGRVHTSACTVAVLPELDEIGEVNLNPADLRIDVF